ncbi:hypothetical protein ONS95_004560 [Cadophora gregata]|uniref:uncharacterized protein n=1 Tax=Cadophora gregata TaxID=51156 RepID=UPI0026DCAA12|nr:uncharacterized protein ONS95_004560 [Cadophora gregata]KAK0106055.1 hypothetical protein ONS95_004560 [Cadophora gregata]
MEILRASSLRHFHERITFTEKEQNSHVLASGPKDASPAKWIPYAMYELLEQTKLQLTAGKSVLVCIPRIKKDLSIDFRRQLFMELFTTLQLDVEALRPLSSIETTFCRVFGAGSGSFYVRIGNDMLIWTFDAASGTTRGLLIPCAPSSVLNSRLEDNFKLLKQPLGLLWQCFVIGIESMKDNNDRCWRVLQTVEEGTGYGKIHRPQHSNDPDIFTEWSREVARVAVELAVVRRDYEDMCAIYQELACLDDSGQPLFRDQDALRVARGHLDHEMVKAKYLYDRMQNQMSVLFNLIARADTFVTIELTKTSKQLTEHNLAVARAAKDDSGAMKTISVMTMLFLPATFFAALFSMPTLQWDQSEVMGNKFWIYWAFTIPVTLLIFFIWTVTNYQASKNFLIPPEHSVSRIYNTERYGLRQHRRRFQSNANVECG